MKEKKTFGVWLVEGIMHLFARLPLKFHYGMGRFVSWLVGDVFHYRRSVVMANLSRSFPDADYDELEAISKQFYRHFGELVAEAVWFGGCRGEKGRKKLTGSDIVVIGNSDEFNDFYDRSSSVMLLNSHAGNWELMGGVAQYDRSAPGRKNWGDKQVVVLYMALASKLWDRVIADNRQAPVLDLDYEGYVESRALLRYAISHKEDKKLYICNTDQFPYWHTRRYQVGTFLHQETKAMGGSAALACKMGMSVGYIRWFRTSRGHYRMDFVPLCEDASTTTPEEILNLFYKHLEEDIQAQPWNYLWTHKRWRKIE